MGKSREFTGFCHEVDFWLTTATSKVAYATERSRAAGARGGGGYHSQSSITIYELIAFGATRFATKCSTRMTHLCSDFCCVQTQLFITLAEVAVGSPVWLSGVCAVGFEVCGVGFDV